jgi:hypothetical protein
MVYRNNKINLGKIKEIVKKMRTIDKVLIVLAIVSIIAALIVSPKEAVRTLTPKVDITISVPQNSALASGLGDELISEALSKKLIREFEENNRGISVHIEEDKTEESGEADIIIYKPLFETRNRSGMTDETLLFAGIIPFFYNISRLEALGFDRPPKTRADFLEVCQKFKEKSNAAYAYSFSENIFTSILPWFYQINIKTDIKTDMKDFDWASKASIETFTFLNTLVEQKFAASDSIYKKESEIFNDFANGSAIMMIAPSSLIKLTEKAAPELKYSVSSIPAPTSYSGRPIFNLNMYNVAINTNSTHKEDAALFSDFIISKRDELAKQAGIIPGNLSETLERSANRQDENIVIEKAMDLYEGGLLVNECETIADSAAFEYVMKQELEKMWKGLQTPSETAKKVKERLD